MRAATRRFTVGRVAKATTIGVRGYLVEMYWPGVTEALAVETTRRAQRTTRRMALQGAQIRYRGTFLMRKDEVAFCLFEATSEATVVDACRKASLRFDRIVDMIAIESLA